ncbi:unnamed protein product [Paramecium pentaurelia]|uniref:Uncharacterized protein n=1 Tax=Paramecium pentaurelia TaxID=43138 RepID=A0A8S1RWD6_9CILI|nr:unnamed protein product [Paramecium pentaurelia]
MIRSFKQYTQETSKRLLSPLQSSHFGYSPEPNLISKPQTHLARKSSLIDLRQFEERKFQLPKQKENNIIRKPVTSDPMSSKKILQIVKEAQQQLYSSQQPRTQQQVQQQKQIRAITLENQIEGLNFTFAQNFSNKKEIMKEFSAHCLKKKFFA